MNLSSLLFNLAPLIFLYGCSTSYKETFDCEPGTGIGCHSISQINTWVDQGRFTPKENKRSPMTYPLVPTSTLSETLIGSHSKRRIMASSPVTRTPEQTLEVWIRDYIDPNGHYYEAARVHMVVVEPQWQIKS